MQNLSLLSNQVMNFVKEQMDPEEKAIIFCGKKARVDDLSSEFSLAGICCSCIHGDRDQSDREQALLDIKDGVVKILIATDVASRGIDIQDLSYVINYDFPRNIEEYVHVSCLSLGSYQMTKEFSFYDFIDRFFYSSLSIACWAHRKSW